MIDNLRMSEREYAPFGVEIHVTDFDRSLNFYRDLLGFKLLRIDEPVKFASFVFHRAIFMIDAMGETDSPPPRGQGAILRFLLPGNLRQYHDEIKSRGANITKPIKQMSYGLTRFYVTDPDGYQLKFSIKS